MSVRTPKTDFSVASLDQAEAKVDAEMRWLSRHRHTLIEAFIVDVQDITGKIKDKK
jgi:hypothetical protein